jgi:hypothetical protein
MKKHANERQSAISVDERRIPILEIRLDDGGNEAALMMVAKR